MVPLERATAIAGLILEGTPAGGEAGDPAVSETGDRLAARDAKLMVAAYDLLGEYGLEGLTVRAVLERTGLNRRAFYERFADKDELVLEVFRRSIQTVVTDCRGQVEALHDPLVRLRFIINYLVLPHPQNEMNSVQALRRNAALCREHMRLAESRADDLRNALQPLIQLFAEQLAAGIACGLVRDVAPQRLANLVYNLVSTTVYAEVLSQEDASQWPDRTQLADDIWDFCHRGVCAD